MLTWRKVCAAFLTLFAAGVATFQLRHYVVYRHLVPFGVHADVRWEDAELAPGWRPRLYWAEVVNFGPWPAVFVSCRYTTDTNSPGVELAWGLERWNQLRKAWEIRDLPERRDWCDPRPIPTSRGGAIMSRERLWPGQGVRVMDWTVVHAQGDFEPGDSARFVVFRTLNEPERWDDVVMTQVFTIAGQMPPSDSLR